MKGYGVAMKCWLCHGHQAFGVFPWVAELEEIILEAGKRACSLPCGVHSPPKILPRSVLLFQSTWRERFTVDMGHWHLMQTGCHELKNEPACPANNWMSWYPESR
jgi:hypothetical protein